MSGELIDFELSAKVARRRHHQLINRNSRAVGDPHVAMKHGGNCRGFDEEFATSGADERVASLGKGAISPGETIGKRFETRSVLDRVGGGFSATRTE